MEFEREKDQEFRAQNIINQGISKMQRTLESSLPLIVHLESKAQRDYLSHLRLPTGTLELSAGSLTVSCERSCGAGCEHRAGPRQDLWEVELPLSLCERAES